MLTVDKTKPNKEALRILRKYEITEPYVPVEGLPKKEGIRLLYLDLQDDLCGLALIKHGLKTIVVNSNHHTNRQRFTIAHELGHFLLHNIALDTVHVDAGLIMRRDRSSSTGEDRLEVEANAFASTLLMPKFMLDKHVPSELDFTDDGRMKEIARLFRVSPAALQFRLMSL